MMIDKVVCPTVISTMGKNRGKVPEAGRTGNTDKRVAGVGVTEVGDTWAETWSNWRGRPAEVCGRAFQVEGTAETQPSILEVTMNMWWFITKLYKTTNFRAEVRFWAPPLRYLRLHCINSCFLAFLSLSSSHPLFYINSVFLCSGN